MERALDLIEVKTVADIYKVNVLSKIYALKRVLA